MLTHILHWGLYLSFLNYHLPIETNNYKYNSSKLRISSNLVSLTHALGTIGGSAYLLYKNNLNKFNGIDKNSLTLITFSASYFIYDFTISSNA